MLKNNKGFSLIELMVVVAIIAILSTIAIPSYQSFQAKARQKEAFALLGAYYSGSHAASAEYGGFPGNFVLAGFSPAGRLGYRVTAADSGLVLPFGGIINDTACVNTSIACNCGGACANFRQWTEFNPNAVLTSIGAFTTAPAGVVSTVNTFTVVAAGVIDTRAGARDEVSMTHQKVTTIVSDGTK